MKFLSILVLAGMLFIPSQGFAKTQILFIHSGESKNPIKLEFNGIQYKDKLNFNDLVKQKKPLNYVQRFIINAVAVNTSGDKNKLLSLWAPAERAHIKEYIDNLNYYKKNNAFYKNVKSSRFIALMEYGKYTICFVEHDLRGVGPYIKTYAVLHKGKKLYLSNGLVGDFFYDNVAPQLEKYFLKHL